MTLRVLHCIYDDPRNPWVGGGGALRVWELYRRLATSVKVTVATGRYPGCRDEVLEGVRYVRLGMERPYLLSRAAFAREATRCLRAGDFDVGLFDFSVYTPIFLPRSVNIGAVVHMLHGPTAGERWGRIGGALLSAVEQRMLRRAHRLCATSHWLQQQLLQLFPGVAIEVVRSGVADEFFQLTREEGDYLLFYGRFDIFQKGIDTVLEAFAHLAEAHPTVVLRVAGRGKDAERVRSNIARHPYRSRIELWESPNRTQVLRLMQGAILFLMPSRVEGLPMAPAEAMAAAVPVIASDVGAVREVVNPPAGGVLVPAADSRALAREADALLRDPNRREQVSRTAREAARRFTWESVAAQHLEFLHRIACGSSGRR